MRSPKRAFTLIEILIVVVILGILAAIVIPQFTDASEEAMTSSLKSQLQTLRSQIELFRVKNGGTLPDLLNTGWDDLVDNDYIQQEPVNPFQDSSTIAAAAAVGVGWVWNAGEENLYGVDADGNQFVE
jgi:general secretion pathway protein G